MKFHIELAQPSFDRGTLQLHQLRVVNEVLAASCCNLAKGTYHSFHKGFDPDWRRNGPGNGLQHFEIGQATEEGVWRMIGVMGRWK